MKRPNVRILGIEEGEASQLQGPENIFYKIIEKKCFQPKERDACKHTKGIQNTN